MIRFKDISIPKPCSVDYDSLPYDEVKRFCSSCEKHVYDFRGKDEAYFNSIISTHGKVCGIFYEDDIQATTLKIKRPFYYTLITKTLGLALFLKTILSNDYVQASSTKTHIITQQSTDSSAVKVKFNNKLNYYVSYSMDIFINNTLYKSGYNLDKETGYIWLPDSLKENDKIKVIVHGSKNTFGRYIYKTKKHRYTFLYRDSNEITIQITNKRKATLLKKRRPHAAGYYDY